ncbi:MAG TPA: IclR family transcriptional regulator [Nocardioidaceae bacterium]|nr:IclR family transcriptional regulator [Nocardioidaceae bacterium]
MPDTPGTVYSQTLDRGIRALQALAAAERPLSVQELAGELGLHRSIAYRILRTLEAHRLIERDDRNRFSPGVGLSALARTVRRELQTAALPEMADVADEVAMTTFLVVPEHGEAVTVASVEPRHTHVHVAYRPGIRHPVDKGAPGLALLAGASPVARERQAVAQARARGWATSHQEVLPGMRSLAVPIVLRNQVRAAIAVVYVDSNVDVEAIGARLVAAARAIEAELQLAGPQLG